MRQMGNSMPGQGTPVGFLCCSGPTGFYWHRRTAGSLDGSGSVAGKACGSSGLLHFGNSAPFWVSGMEHRLEQPLCKPWQPEGFRPVNGLGGNLGSG